MSEWLEFDSNDSYAKKVSIRRDHISAVIDSGVMEYNASKQPEGLRRVTMIYTIGGNCLPVKMDREEVLAILAGAKSAASPNTQEERNG